MTAKEKAVDLIIKYTNLTEDCDCLEYMCICFSIPEYRAKQCALIAVDQLLNEYWHHDIKRKMYWREVKQEIIDL